MVAASDRTGSSFLLGGAAADVNSRTLWKGGRIAFLAASTSKASCIIILQLHENNVQYALLKRTGSVPSNFSLYSKTQSFLARLEGSACNLSACSLTSFSLVLNPLLNNCHLIRLYCISNGSEGEPASQALCLKANVPRKLVISQSLWTDVSKSSQVSWGKIDMLMSKTFWASSLYYNLSSWRTYNALSSCIAFYTEAKSSCTSWTGECWLQHQSFESCSFRETK